MTDSRDKKPRLAAAIAVLAWSAFGIACPLILTLDAPDIAVQTASVAASAGDAFALSEPLALGPASLGLSADRGTLQVADGARRSLSGDAARSLLATGSATLVAEGMVFSLHRKSNSAVDVDVAAPFAKALRDGQFETLLIRRGSISIPLGEKRTETLTGAELEIVNRRRAGFTVRGTAELRGIRHTIDATFGAVNTTRTEGRILTSMPGRISVRGPLLAASFDGRMASTDGQPPALIGALDAQAPDAIRTARALGISVRDSSAPVDMRIRGQVDWSVASMALDKVTFQLGANEAEGVLVVGFGPTRSSLGGTLAFKTLDLTPLWNDRKGDRPQDKLISWLSWLPWPVENSLAAQIDADMRISAARIKVPNAEFGATALSLNLKSGLLNADLAEFVFGGGRGTGQLTADLSRGRPTVTWRGRIDGIDAATLSTTFVGYPVMQGTASLVGDVKSEGLWQGQFERTLSGRVSLKLRDGAKLGIDLRPAATETLRLPIYGWNLLSRTSMPVDQFDARLSFNGGYLVADQVTARSGDLALTATGSLDLLNQRMDIDTGVGGTTLQPARTRSLIGQPDLAIGVIQFRGPWSTPLIRREISGGADPLLPVGGGKGGATPRVERVDGAPG